MPEQYSNGAIGCLIRATLVLILLSASLRLSAQTKTGDRLAAGFKNVPQASRMRMFWRVFGPAWTRGEIDYQLDLLKQAGVGGVMTCFTYPVSLDDPAHNIRNQAFLSPEFLDTLGHAARQAKRNGLEFNVCGGTGWPFGGPSVRLEDSVQRIRMQALEPLKDGSGWRLPKLRDGEKVLAAFVGPEDRTAFVRGGRLISPATPGAQPPSANVFIVGPTYQKVKRSSLGAEGFVIDHYSREATLRFLNAVVAPILKAAPKDAPVHTLFCDSLEVYDSNWTTALPAEFRARRGYDLLPYLPELFDERAKGAADVRFDFWRTLAELAEEKFARTVHQWCAARGVKFALEAYGTPPTGLTAAQQCDYPWGEQYEYKGFSFSRFASSGAHLAGKQIIGAEAWTWAGIPNRLADSLADLKGCSDLHFLAGENELTGVDFAYSPRQAPAPGWLPYYGPVMNQNNPQWAVFPSLVSYVNRCQWILQQGKPVADVALYLPVEDAFAEGPVSQMPLDFKMRDKLATVRTDEFGLKKAQEHYSEVINAIQSAGLNFDGLDFFAMNSLVKVEAGHLVAGDGQYRVLILPDLKGVDLAAMEKIAAFCRSGGRVFATGRLPDRVYGRNSLQDTERLNGLVKEMFGLTAAEAQTWSESKPTTDGTAYGFRHEHGYGSGEANFVPQVKPGSFLAVGFTDILALGDFFGPPTPIYHVHRRIGQRDFYFIPYSGGAGTIQANGTLAFWNPMDGSITPVPAASKRGYMEFFLPAASGFLCLTPDKLVHSQTLVPSQAEFATRSSFLFTDLNSSDWRVTFQGSDAPPSHVTRDLDSWTTWPGGKFFSGQATYTASFDSRPEMRKRCVLEFEQVHEAAIVKVNGRRAGTVWTPRYEIDVTRFIKPGRNLLEIEVFNLPVNRVLGLPDPDLRSLRAVYGNRFPDPEEKRVMLEPAPSGLIGRVTVQTPAPKSRPQSK